MERHSRLQRWFGTGTSGRPDEGAEAAVRATPADIDLIRQALIAAVAPCGEAHRLRAADQVNHAQSVLELWLIRADLFQYLAQDIGQMHAAQQLAGMMPLFAGMPGVAGLQESPHNRGHDPRLPRIH